jgi:hypothetical protein
MSADFLSLLSNLVAQYLQGAAAAGTPVSARRMRRYVGSAVDARDVVLRCVLCAVSTVSTRPMALTVAARISALTPTNTKLNRRIVDLRP